MLCCLVVLSYLVFAGLVVVPPPVGVPWRPICGWRVGDLAVLLSGLCRDFGKRAKSAAIIHESTGATGDLSGPPNAHQYNANATPGGAGFAAGVRLAAGAASLRRWCWLFHYDDHDRRKRMVEKMRQYGNALEVMSNEAVEYVQKYPGGRDFRAIGIFLQSSRPPLMSMKSGSFPTPKTRACP